MRFPNFIAPREESEASLLRAPLRSSASLCVSALSFSPLFRLLNEFRARCSRRLPRPGRRVSFFSCFQLSTFNFQPSISCAALRLQRLPRPDQGVSFFPSFQLSTFNFQPSLLFFALFLVFSPAAPSQVPSGREVVKPEVYASLDPAGRGSSFQIAVVMKIRPGFHVNAREKSEEYLIATDLKAALPAGFNSGDVSYPKGKLEKFAFSKIPLNVYQDTVILRMPITALENAPLGEQHIPLKLRYQACSTELCLPPATLNPEAILNVVASASAAKPAHSEIFRKQ